MSQAVRLAVVALALAFGGCGGQTGSGGATGGSGGATGGSGGATGGSGGATGGSGGTGGSSGSCMPNQPCKSGQYCDYPDDRCGSGAAGKCTPIPQGCDLMYAPVCDCSGAVAGNECSAYFGGWDINANATCKPPDGTFGCGTKFCNVGSQYCRRTTSDVGGTPDSFSCNAAPSSCAGTPSCACLGGEPCGTYCAADASGNVTLTCPGG